MRKVPFTLLLALLSLLTAYAGDPFSARCVGVTDGDTITVLTTEKQEIKIRIEGIDCPEGSQDFSRKAKDFTSALVFGKTVTIKPKEYDDYGRLVGRVELDGIDASLALATAGLAWHFKKYDSNAVLARAEEVSLVRLRSASSPCPIPYDFSVHAFGVGPFLDFSQLSSRGSLHPGAAARKDRKAERKNPKA